MIGRPGGHRPTAMAPVDTLRNGRVEIVQAAETGLALLQVRRVVHDS